VVDGVATDLGLNPQSLPPLAESATLWVRVISDGTDVTVKAIENAGEPSEGAWSNATVYYQTSSSTNRFSWFGGGFGFRGNSYNSADIDSLTLKTDRDADGTYENTELEESFTLDSNGMAPTEPTYDKAGNLTYDGRFKYAYDGWNRLVTVEKAYRTASDDGAGGVTLGAVQTGSVVQEVAYDGLGRRIVNAVKNSGDLSMTYHYYYDGQRLIETRNGSDQVLKQYVWAPQTGGAGGSAGGYVDELVHIRVNDSPATSQYCTVEYWALTGVNHNVLGVIPNLRLAASPQRLVERYEYTPYGQRQVFKSAGLNDPDTSAPTAMSQRLGYGGAPGEPGSTHPYGLNPFGHQGLYHDPTTGLIVNNERYRHPVLGRYTTADPINTPLVSPLTQAMRQQQRGRSRGDGMGRYADGMNLYQMLGSNPVNRLDPTGLKVVKTSEYQWWQTTASSVSQWLGGKNSLKASLSAKTTDGKTFTGPPNANNVPTTRWGFSRTRRASQGPTLYHKKKQGGGCRIECYQYIVADRWSTVLRIPLPGGYSIGPHYWMQTRIELSVCADGTTSSKAIPNKTYARYKPHP